MKKILIPTALLLLACTPEGKLETLAALPLEEVSGIEYMPDGTLWALEDAGNKDKIYAIGQDGKITREIKLGNVKNNDWEDLAADSEGNLYIGDFGNNDNDRKNLAIYKIDKAALSEGKADAYAIITFSYPDQKEFPPKKSGRFFDVEAFYEHNGSFYLFTKNRSSGFDGSLFVYKVPNTAGNHIAEKIGTLTTCGMYKKCAVTGADISPDGKAAVLIAGDRLWLLTGFSADDFGNVQMQEYQLGHYTQKEGITFKDANTLLIADEKDKRGGGNLYSVKIADLKAK